MQGSTMQLTGVEPSLQAPPVVLLVAMLLWVVLLLVVLLVALGRGFWQTAVQPPQ